MVTTLSHSAVNTGYAHASSYPLWSLGAALWLDSIPIKLQLTGMSRLIFVSNFSCIGDKWTQIR